MLLRLFVLVTGLASLLPLVLMGVAGYVLLNARALFPFALVQALLIAIVVLWVPTVGFLLYKVNTTEQDASVKMSWIGLLLMWAPVAAPVAWYRYVWKAENK